MESPGIVVERQGARADLVLSRPAKRNAITRDIWLALPGLCAELDADPAVLAVVLRGAGGKAFSAGADIGEFAEVYGTNENRTRYNAAVEAGFDAVAGLAKPAIAMIEGACVGGGCGIALACDFRLAAATARFAITPARLGTVYSFSETRRLVQAVGASRAKEMLCTGRTVGAQEAEAIGLVNQVVPDDALAQATAAFVARLTEVSQYSVRTMKAMVDAVASGADAPSPELAARHEASFSGADFLEGFSAFLEKRKPVFGWR